MPSILICPARARDNRVSDGSCFCACIAISPIAPSALSASPNPTHHGRHFAPFHVDGRRFAPFHGRRFAPFGVTLVSILRSNRRVDACEFTWFHASRRLKRLRRLGRLGFQRISKDFEGLRRLGRLRFRAISFNSRTAFRAVEYVRA